MAIPFHITPATSVFNQLLPLPGTDGNAFDSDSPGADTLIVDSRAFLISVFADGAFLAPTGAWIVTVNGEIASQTHVGIDLAAGNTAVSTIKIGVNGGVQGGPTGIYLGSSANVNNTGTIVAQSGGIGIQIANSGTNTITNSGEINVSFTGFGIEATVTSNDTVHNSGTIDGIINLSDGNDTVTNSGHVFGDVMLGGGTNHLTNSGHAHIVFGGSGADTVTNSGDVEGVALGEGTNRLTNSGTVGDAGPGNSSFSGGGGADTVTNTGTIFSPVLLGEGNNTLTNSGKLVGLFGGVVGGGGNDRVTNSGTIGTDFVTNVELGAGNNTLINSGTISGDVSGDSGNDMLINSGKIGEQSHSAKVQLGDGNNTFINSGTIFGDVSGGGGVDKVTDFAIVDGVMQSGTINGTISFGNGNDIFIGGANSERIQDGNGADTYTLGGGRDWYVATGNTGSDGNDLIKAGTGNNVYDAQAAFSDCQINLDSFSHGLLAPNTALGAAISGSAKDSIFGFETVFSGSGNDVIYGTAAGNTLSGGDGNDSLFGLGGNDTLDGGGGNDDLFGGAGADQLTGGFGTGADTFHYTALSDSGITAGTRDLIADFSQSDGDKIDLSAIDANTKTPGDDAFNFVGTNIPTGFSGTPGELHALWNGIGQIVEGDVNGDKKPDFSIEIADPNHAITLTSASFVL